MADGRGRPRLDIGALGSVTYAPTSTGTRASGRTRDAAGKLRRIEATGATEDEALAALTAKAARLGVLAPTTVEVATLGSLLDRWLEDIADTRNVLEQTRRMYRTKAGRLAGKFGAIALTDLRRARVQVLLNEMAREYSAGEFSVLRGILNRALNYGVMLEVLEANHLGATETPRLAPVGNPISLTAAQLAAFLEEFDNYVGEGVRESNRRKAQLVAHIILGLGGLRPAEALAIRHGDVDFDASRHPRGLHPSSGRTPADPRVRSIPSRRHSRPVSRRRSRERPPEGGQFVLRSTRACIRGACLSHARCRSKPIPCEPAGGSTAVSGHQRCRRPVRKCEREPVLSNLG